MLHKTITKTVFFFIGTIFFAATSLAQLDKKEQHILVTMRLIGHKLLLNSEDSTSAILPIKKEGDRYKIQFESEFKFEPQELVATIDSVMLVSRIASSYLVEVEQCNTKDVVYSYENVQFAYPDMIPCGERAQPKDCYEVFITILDTKSLSEVLPLIEAKDSKILTNFKQKSFLIILVLIIVVLFFILLGRRLKTTKDPDVFDIGKYKFDKRKMELSFEKRIIELTSKEAELLSLLQLSANSTLERELILQTVWGDEGDYIGRTLDVFISKLRKKLAADEDVKIVNVRGVGYKLVMEV